jgi:hypothetical protein
MSARARATFLPSELCWQAAEPADFNLSCAATAAFFIFNLRRRGKSRRATYLVSSKVALAPALIGKLKERRVWCQRCFLPLESSVWGKGERTHFSYTPLHPSERLKTRNLLLFTA